MVRPTWGQLLARVTGCGCHPLGTGCSCPTKCPTRRVATSPLDGKAKKGATKGSGPSPRRARRKALQKARLKEKAKIPPKEKNPKGRGRRAKARVTRSAKTGLANTKDEGKLKQQHRPEPREARADGAADPTAVVVTMMVRPPLKRKVTAVMPETSPARGNMAQAVGIVMSPVTMRTTTKAIMREGLRVRP